MEDFKITYIVRSDELYHHGVLGQKWGVRRYQNYDGTRTGKRKTNYHEKGGIIKKGSTLYRINRTPEDRTYDNKKYVSTTINDHNKWFNYLGKAYKSYGHDTYIIRYKTIEDIRVASETEAGELFVKSIMNSPDVASATVKIMYDTEQARKFLHYPKKEGEKTGPAETASLNMAAQTETGKEFARLLLQSGYGAVSDTHGRNTSDDPIILLDPDNKIIKTKVYKNKFN